MQIESLDATVQGRGERISYALQRIIDDAVRDAIEDKLKKDFTIDLSGRIDEAIDKTITNATEQKIGGWAKRRVKEMLETVRLAARYKGGESE